ncbi:hypothetical protein [Streptomyces sp. NPDC046821]|uniref:hypothetical protein n=1 Tax=Streptomyces sp. NPDC046821 TaxID=3154702 RepID=UPI0033E313E1
MSRMSARRGPAPAGEPFTVLDFQLVLLRRMADHNPDLVEDARRDLGVSVAQMREANRRFQARRHARGPATGRSFHRSFLGAPDQRVTRQIGDLTCEALRWRVPLWPDLLFEVLTGPNGAVWNEWLIRAPDAPAPVLRTLDDLAPWAYTVDEVSDAFPPARPLEGSAPTRWGLAFMAPDATGTLREVRAEFTYGLLQRWTVTQVP